MRLSVAWHVAVLYLRRTFRGRTVAVSVVGVPLLFTWILGLAMVDVGVESPPAQNLLLVVSDDPGSLDELFVHRLSAQRAIVTRRVGRYAALNAVDDGYVLGALVLPPNFSQRLQRREDARLELHSRARDLRAVQLAEQAVQSAITELGGVVDASRVSVRTAGRLGYFDRPDAPQDAATFFATSLSLAEEGLAISAADVVERPVTRNERTRVASGFDQTSPGMLVMFTLFVTLGGAAVLVAERELGTLARLATTPVTPSSVVCGRLLGLFLGAAIQVSLLLAAGRLLLGVRWGRDPAALVLVAGSFALAAACGTLLLAGAARTRAQAGAVRTLAVLTLAALGGAWWPLEIVPGWMRHLGSWMPTAWAMDGFQDVVVRGLGVAEVIPESAALSGFAALCFLLALLLGRIRGSL